MSDPSHEHCKIESGVSIVHVSLQPHTEVVFERTISVSIFSLSSTSHAMHCVISNHSQTVMDETLNQQEEEK